MLVPGCGTAPEPVAFAEKGAQVTAIDIAPSAIEAQRASFCRSGLSADLLCGDIFSWRSAVKFDIIYEQTCLCAINPLQRPAYEVVMWALMRPGGSLYALFMQTRGYGGPPFHCPLAEMKALFAESRWDWSPGNQPFSADHPLGVHELGVVLTRKDVRSH